MGIELVSVEFMGDLEYVLGGLEELGFGLF